MSVMTPAHAKPKDHTWVLFVIAAAVLAEVWASWVGIGAISGFPAIGRIPTDWVLAVAMEAYWGYALYAWLVASPGPRSRAMAMWSCAAVFVLSIIGQVLYHEITAPPGTAPGKRVVIGFVTSLPVIVLALIAVLIHLRQRDREEAAEVVRRDALAEELAAEKAAREAADAARVEALREVATLTRKLVAAGRKQPRKSAGATGRKPAGNPVPATARKQEPATASGEAADETADLDSEALVLQYMSEGLSASAAGIKAGLTDSRGRQIARKFAAAAPVGQDAEGGAA